MEDSIHCTRTHFACFSKALFKKVLYFAHKIKTDHGAELNLKKNA